MSTSYRQSNELSKDFIFVLYLKIGLTVNELKDSEIAELCKLYAILFKDDIKYMILKFLSSKDVASIREISRNVGMSHKNLAKYLDFLVRNDALEVVYSSPTIKLYKLSQRGSIFKKFYK